MQRKNPPEPRQIPIGRAVLDRPGLAALLRYSLRTFDQRVADGHIRPAPYRDGKGRHYWSIKEVSGLLVTLRRDGLLPRERKIEVRPVEGDNIEIIDEVGEVVDDAGEFVDLLTVEDDQHDEDGNLIRDERPFELLTLDVARRYVAEAERRRREAK